jgi:hypothetical protein
MEHEISALLERAAVRPTARVDIISILVRGQRLRRNRIALLTVAPVLALLVAPVALRLTPFSDLGKDRSAVSGTRNGDAHADCLGPRPPLVVFFEKSATTAQIDGAWQAAGKLSETRGVYKSSLSEPGAMVDFPGERELWAAYDPPDDASTTWLHINALGESEARVAARALKDLPGVLAARVLTPQQRVAICRINQGG